MANRFLVAGGDGNWNNTNNWAATTGAASGASFPVAGDVVAFDSNSGNANMTVNVASACASIAMSGTYAGTLTFNSTLTITGLCTFVAACTIAGTTGTLICNGTGAKTSGGKTITCGLNLGTGTHTLQDDWTVSGLVSITGSATINQNSTQKLSCSGGIHFTASTGAGTAKVELTGGTWDGSSSFGLINNLDLSGNVTVSGSVLYGGSSKTLRYVSGTITTTGSTLVISPTTTLDTAGVTWNSVTISGSGTYTLSSNLAWSGTLTLGGAAVTTTVAGAGTLLGTGAITATGTATITLNNTGGLVTTGTMTLPNGAITFAGSAGWTVGTLTNTSYTASRTITLTFGNTYTVTTSIANVGTTAAIRQAFVSGTPGSKVVLNVTVGATETLAFCDPTDIDSSGGAQVTSINGTITTSLNWVGNVSTTPTGGRPLHSRLVGRAAA